MQLVDAFIILAIGLLCGWLGGYAFGATCHRESKPERPYTEHDRERDDPANWWKYGGEHD